MNDLIKSFEQKLMIFDQESIERDLIIKAKKEKEKIENDNYWSNFKKFQEAKDLVENGSGFSIANSKQLKNVFCRLQDQSACQEAGKLARAYVLQKAGATQIIMKYLKGASVNIKKSEEESSDHD